MAGTKPALVRGVRKLGLILLMLVGVASSAPASAEPERLVGYGGFGTGLGGLYGPLGKSFDSNVVRSTLHGGLRLGEFAASLNFTFGILGSDEVALHSDSLVSFEVGPNIRYTFGWPNHMAQLYVRGGMHRVWWQGGREVQRTCRQTGECAAGFYAATPSYAGFAGRLGVGMQFTPPTRRARSPYLHFALDLGVELLSMKLVTERERGHMITASFQVAYGGGRKGRQR